MAKLHESCLGNYTSVSGSRPLALAGVLFIVRVKSELSLTPYIQTMRYMLLRKLGIFPNCLILWRAVCFHTPEISPKYIAFPHPPLIWYRWRQYHSFEKLFRDIASPKGHLSSLGSFIIRHSHCLLQHFYLFTYPTWVLEFSQLQNLYSFYFFTHLCQTSLCTLTSYDFVCCKSLCPFWWLCGSLGTPMAALWGWNI